MDHDAVFVLTSKSLHTMIEEGGSGDWRAKEESIRRRRWIVGVRNRHSDWSQGEEDHGAAFIIGRIVGVKASASEPHRLVIQFDKYAHVNVPNAWSGSRNPVVYRNLSDLGIDPETLDWEDFPLADYGPNDEIGPRINPKASVVFDQAKAMIAAALSIDASTVRITITI
jgi:hypothetical protein